MNHRYLSCMERFRAVAVSFAFLSTPYAIAAPKATGETVPVDPALELIVVAPKGARAYTTPPIIPITLSGQWSIEKGPHRIEKLAISGGRRYALIPWVRRKPYEDKITEIRKDESGCEGSVRHYAAIDLETATLNRESWIATSSNCSIGDRFDQKIWLISEYSYNGFQINQVTVAEKEAAAHRDHERKLEKQRQRDFTNQMEAPAKRQIGATLCTVRGGMGYAGYTEQVSPDNDKIRIRVVRQFDPRNNQFMLSNPPEQNIWESPDNWYICNF